MCVITRVVSVGEADVTTEADLDPDGVFATHWRPDGELPEAFFLEVMAQTIGIWSHVHDDLTVVPVGDRKADAGLLLSVRGQDRALRQERRGHSCLHYVEDDARRPSRGLRGHGLVQRRSRRFGTPHRLPAA